MTTVNVNEIDLNEFIGKEDPKQHCKATFPLVSAHGSKKLATVYLELEPGDNLGRHTDSAEELLVVLDGTVEALVGEEKRHAEKGALILVPEMLPHDLKNIGNTKAEVLGVFGGANNIVATFDKVMLPTESNIVDTALLFD
ncbi:MAG TPA: cupin domain-containing protein [Flavobacteriaceae bacterium]|nr:cupin domain-containing protein [Flavobacteriaceae bacterium]